MPAQFFCAMLYIFWLILLIAAPKIPMHIIIIRFNNDITISISCIALAENWPFVQGAIIWTLTLVSRSVYIRSSRHQILSKMQVNYEIYIALCILAAYHSATRYTPDIHLTQFKNLLYNSYILIFNNFEDEKHLLDSQIPWNFPTKIVEIFRKWLSKS